MKSSEKVRLLEMALCWALSQMSGRIETVVGVSCKHCNSNVISTIDGPLRHEPDCPWVGYRKLAGMEP